jgi:MinD-like ATPase involved in chromosome partitioning or flagellar assembly
LKRFLKRPIDFVLPYEAGEVNKALNFGQPFILTNPDLPICLALEIMAYQLSDQSLKALPPAVPSPTWKRVTAQLGK